MATMKPPKANNAKPLPVPGIRAAAGVGKLAPAPKIKDIAPLASFPAPKSRFPWEGGKTGMPRVRGAAKAHRAKQIEATGYPNMKLKSLMRGL